MKSKLILIVIAVIILAPVGRAEDRIIKIGLIDNASQVIIRSEKGIRVLTDDGQGLKLSSKSSYKFIKQDNDILFNNKSFIAKSILLWSAQQSGLISVNGRWYRGYLEILNTKQGLTIINYVKFNDYLASVVGSEVNPNWPMEALKAQAVVARTYALRNLNSHLKQGYNLSATVRSQAYKGVAFETDRTITAVQETTDEVVTYNGNLIAAVYHSTAGGRTAKGAVIWSSDTPYLQSVPSNDSISPFYSWKKVYSKGEIEKILASKGLRVSDLQKITLRNLGPSGRPEEVLIHDTDNNYSIDSSQFRFWLGLRSTKFKVAIEDNYFKLRREKDRFSFNLESLMRDNSFSEEYQSQNYVFTGHGWGHGVGMSQWGAYQMAQQGFAYQEILTHYYIGTRIIKIEDGGIVDEG